MTAGEIVLPGMKEFPPSQRIRRRNPLPPTRLAYDVGEGIGPLGPQERAKQVRVVIVDQYPLLRRGLRAALEEAEGFVVCGEASTGDEALRLAETVRPDVIVLDNGVGFQNGSEICHQIRSFLPSVELLILSNLVDEHTIVALIRAGVRGYLLKTAQCDEVVKAIRHAAGGDAPIDPTASRALLNLIRKRPEIFEDEKLRLLTPQELRILQAISSGHTNPQIATTYGLSTKTVSNYVSRILWKLGVARRAEAAAYLVRHGEFSGSSRDWAPTGS
jgi:two-component system, NarL family, response regulator DevR